MSDGFWITVAAMLVVFIGCLIGLIDIPTKGAFFTLVGSTVALGLVLTHLTFPYDDPDYTGLR